MCIGIFCTKLDPPHHQTHIKEFWVCEILTWYPVRCYNHHFPWPTTPPTPTQEAASGEFNCVCFPYVLHFLFISNKQSGLLFLAEGKKGESLLFKGWGKKEVAFLGWKGMRALWLPWAVGLWVPLCNCPPWGEGSMCCEVGWTPGIGLLTLLKIPAPHMWPGSSRSGTWVAHVDWGQLLSQY